MTIKLYHGEGSNCCQRIKWILAYKGVPFEAIDCTEMPPEEYAKINPFRFAPTLIVDDKVVLESLVQAELLEELFPEPTLISSAPWERVTIRQVCQVVAATIHPLQTNRIAKHVVPNGSSAEIKRYRLNVIHDGLTKLEPLLFREGAFCVGTQFSLADIFVIPLYLKAKNLDPMLQISSFNRLLEACRSQEKIIRSSPDDMIGLI